MTPAATIRTARERLGLTRKDLARALGVSPDLVKSWELGRREVRPAYLLAVRAIEAARRQ